MQQWIFFFIFGIFFFTSPSFSQLSFTELNAANCGECDEYGMGFVCKVDELKNLSTLVVNSLYNIKSSLQVDEYIRCQILGRQDSNKQEKLERYLKEYRYYIKTTAESFDVPPQLLQCLLLKESVYDEDIGNSTSGAKGLCQMLPITRDHINGIISNANLRRSTGKIQKIRSEISAGQVKAVDEDYYATVVKQDNLLEMWNQNFEKLKQQNRYPLKSIPTAFSNKGLKMPQNCIAGAGLYFREIMTHLNFNFSDTSMEEIISGAADGSDTVAAINLMLILGAAYNAGPGTVNKFIKTAEKALTLASVVKALENSKNGQMKGYMKSLRNCLTAENFDPPNGWYNKGGMAPPTCEEEKQNAKGLDLTPTKYWLWQK